MLEYAALPAMDSCFDPGAYWCLLLAHGAKSGPVLRDLRVPMPGRGGASADADLYDGPKTVTFNPRPIDEAQHRSAQLSGRAMAGTMGFAAMLLPLVLLIMALNFAASLAVTWGETTTLCLIAAVIVAAMVGAQIAARHGLTARLAGRWGGRDPDRVPNPPAVTQSRLAAAGPNMKRVAISNMPRDLSQSEGIAAIERRRMKLKGAGLLILSPVRLFFGDVARRILTTAGSNLAPDALEIPYRIVSAGESSRDAYEKGSP